MANLYRDNVVRVDIDKPLQRTDVGVLIASGDNMANRFGALVYADNAPVTLTGCSVIGFFIRPHGANGETITISGTVSGNTASVQLPKACYLYSGPFALAIKLTSSTMSHTLRVIDGYIRSTSTDAVVDPDHVIPSLDDLLAQIGTIKDATSAANTAASGANTAKAAANTAATNANNATSATNAATTKANTAASAANTAASSANAAATNANNAATAINGISASATALAAGATPTASITTVSGHKNISLGIPRGATGAQGAQGEQGIQGVQGKPGVDGVGVPSGGSAGQILAKKSATNNDTAWVGAAGVPWLGNLATRKMCSSEVSISAEPNTTASVTVDYSWANFTGAVAYYGVTLMGGSPKGIVLSMNAVTLTSATIFMYNGASAAATKSVRYIVIAAP